jgi:DNA repair protein RadA/Sms
MAGEVGLSGEIRPVSRIMQRIAEAEKLGFSKILVPSANLSTLEHTHFKIEVKGVRRVEEALRELFG